MRRRRQPTATHLWHLSFTRFTTKLQGYFTAVYAVLREPSFPKGLNSGRDGRALALAVPPAALPGLSPACGLARDGPKKQGLSPGSARP